MPSAWNRRVSFEPVDAGEHDVDEREVGTMSSRDLKRRGAVCRGYGREPVGTEVLGEHLNDLGIVVYHQNGGHHASSSQGLQSVEYLTAPAVVPAHDSSPVYPFLQKGNMDSHALGRRETQEEGRFV